MKLPTWPYYDEEQIQAVANVLASGRVNRWTGDESNLFEKEFASFAGATYSVSVANGTLALAASYSALGIGKGDEVITTPRTFLATATTAVMLGATPIFADVDINSGCITAESIEPLITPKTKAISVVHLGGWPADMTDICDMASCYGLKIIEDCSQAHGARLNGCSVGSFGHIATWSFCQEKIISTGGEGGMVTCNDKDLFEYIWSLKDHGKSLDACHSHSSPGFRWLHHKFGSNYRLTEMQSAIGRLQLKRMPEWSVVRSRNAHILYTSLTDHPLVRVPLPPPNMSHAWYKFYAYVNTDALAYGWTRERIFSDIVELGYPIFSGSCSEIYLEKCFQDFDLAPKVRLPNARLMGETSMMFVVHPTIPADLMYDYARAVVHVLNRALR
jgi:dTDP-4-amino-4,6-dideoxygalactose transaminase